jgi:hypothetical protein
MKLVRLFTEHPASVNESYWQHFWHATTFGMKMMVGGAACVVHACLPFIFVRTASQVVARLYLRMVVNRAAPVPITRKSHLSDL